MKPRGLYTTEFWAAAVASTVIVLLVLEGGRYVEGSGLSGLALIVSTYIGGRCLIKAGAGACRSADTVGASVKDSMEIIRHDRIAGLLAAGAPPRDRPMRPSLWSTVAWTKGGERPGWTMGDIPVGMEMINASMRSRGSDGPHDRPE